MVGIGNHLMIIDVISTKSSSSSVDTSVEISCIVTDVSKWPPFYEDT